ncbi:MAG: NAD(P)-dependent dehydrogenase (short-subunit alcohol dehydrogenase family) [Halioglobus sp.]|jgi:NAD(P)-dependent dehydrogenase (short-subunit alcohol dehydrogenase family)
MSEPTKIAVITGGSSGIGAEMAQHLASNGWDIAITYAGNAAGGESTLAAIEASGQRGFMMQCDVGYKDQVDSFLEAATENLGLPQLFVNNAGVQTWAPFLELEEADWDRTLRTNLKGYFLCTQKYARMLVEHKQPGSVVMIGSGCNKVPFPNLVDYTVSKGGIENLTKIAATELGQYGIRVNCVAPGAIEIERTRLESPGYADTWSKAAPLGRVGYAVDIAQAVEYLAGATSSYVTGQTLYVDGGAFTKPNWPYEA